MLPTQIALRSRYVTRLVKANFCSDALMVQHDHQNSEFAVHLHDSKAFVSYTYDQRKNRISIDHTEVPSVFQGKGVGKKLVEAALQHAIKENMKITFVCEFAQKYYNDNKGRFKDLA
ncbi:AAEL012108-PA [Aedes aegypti]|uniref:Protein NATD1 n=1 Tax=Aedes aegypti TaxID=7159 RepID=Q16N32_AEDAE|nr:AAEL012108-PA [Aedes aegypti]